MNIVNLFKYCENAFHAQRDRWILWTPVPMGCGVITYFSLHAEPPVFLGGMVALLLALVAGVFHRHRVFMLCWLPFFLFAVGFTAAQMRTLYVDAPVLQRDTYPLILQGRVVEVDALPNTYRMVMDEVSITAKWPPKVIPERVRIKIKASDPTQPKAGDIVSVKAVLLPLSPPVAPGAFDFQRHAFFKRLGATGYAIGDITVITPRDHGFFFEELRHAIRKRIAAGIENPEIAATVTAFLIGESKAISEKTWDMIRLSGIAHLLAISGFHITVMIGFSFFLIRAVLAAIPYCALHWPIKKIAAFLSIFAGIFYILLIDSPIPAVRSVMMATVVMTAIIMDRDPLSLRLAAFAVFLMLLFQPEALIGPSFQLSFAAVIALIAFYESQRDFWQKHYEDPSWVRKYSLYMLGCLITTVVATLATAPYSLFHFARVPVLSGLFSNMIAVPVSSFVTLPMGVLACILMPFGLEGVPLWIAGKSMELIMATAREAASWKHAAYQADAWPGYLLGIITLGGLWLCIWQGRMRYFGLIPIVGALLLISTAPRPDVLISDDAFLFAVRRADGGLVISSARKEKFIREEWIEREGGAGFSYADKQKGDDKTLSCDSQACLYRKNGKTVSFVRQPEALVADCQSADVIFAQTAVTDDMCAAQNVFDKWDLRRDGAHAVYIADNGHIIIETVAGLRGSRPWTGKRWEEKRPYLPSRSLPVE